MAQSWLLVDNSEMPNICENGKDIDYPWAMRLPLK
jgi:hypothetical protein